MNILQKLIVKYCELRCKPYLNCYGYATPYLCEKIIGTTDIPFWIYKYQLIALSNYTKQISLDNRWGLLLSIINQSAYDIPHEFIIKQLIYYLFAFPDFSNRELKYIYDYTAWENQEQQFFFYLKNYFNQEFVDNIKSQFLIFKLTVRYIYRCK